MAADQLTKALLLEEVAPPRKVAEALFASVNGGVPLLTALVDSGAVSPEVLSRYLARSEAPFLRQVVPVPELVERLPPGLCARLLAMPVRRDAITGTVDVVVADPADPHPASEIAFHLGAPVRAIRAPAAAIEEALRRLRMASHESRPSLPSPAERFHEAARAAERLNGELYDSRPDPRGLEARSGWANSFPARADGPPDRKPATLPPPVPELSGALPSERDVPPRRGGLVLEDSNPPPPLQPPAPARIRTPPWGTPVHVIRETSARRVPPASDPPQSGYGSEIPIPLTRKTVAPGALFARGGTQRMANPATNAAADGLGDGYAVDPTNLRDVVERRASAEMSTPAAAQPIGTFIPGPPPLPSASGFVAPPQAPFPELHGVLAALRNAGSRDEVLELVLTGARMVAMKVALFVVKKGGYLGWVSSPELADRSSLQSVLIPLDANSIFDRAVREDLYLGPIRYDEVHAPLLRVLKNPSRDVAAVPIRVSGKTAVIIIADELGDTMIGTRRLEELARAAGEAFARIVRTRR